MTMPILSILIALLLERITPQLIELRRFAWLDDYARWMDDVLHISRLGSWSALAFLVLPPFLLVWLLASMFENALFGLFELAFNVFVIFACLGPRELDREIDDYIDAVEMGDEQRRHQAAGRLTLDEPARELGAQAMQVCQGLYVQANGRLFAVIFWFVVLGPVAAVLYRLLEQVLSRHVLRSAIAGMDSTAALLLGWIDWLPTRVTLFAFMLSGSFEDGFQAYREGNRDAIELRDQNHELLHRVGCRCIVSQDVQNADQAVTMIRRSRGLILRSLVVWLLMILFVGWFS
jgi:AmpE protein